ncbi:hypothetical protein ACHAPT_009400 [Fusarium lateritium]
MYIVVQRATDLEAKGERVLVYLRDAPSASELHDMLREAGINSLDFCNTGSQERAFGLAKFNDPKNSEVDVLITTFQRGAGGGNFYGACHYGIVLEYPGDIVTLKKAQRAFCHIGMTATPKWVLLCVTGTYEVLDDLRLAQQEAAMISLTPQIHQDMMPYRAVPESINTSRASIA